jgi:two-component system, chemotaxis family, protein-glutamate methylesterase/glutaminase
VARSSAHAAPRTKVVVCDDSPFMRRLLVDALRACGAEVVAEAGDGAMALELCRRLKPDVMTLDLQMPGLSGMDVLRRMPAGGPGVIVVSAYTTEGSTLAVEALSIGAAEVICKPDASTTLAQFTAQLDAVVRAAAASHTPRGPRPVLRPAPAAPPLPRRDTPPPTASARPASPAPPAAPPARVPGGRPGRLAKPLVVIASSTGGPRALATFVPMLPRPCGAGVVIVQHMPAGFTRSLAERLDGTSALDVREAANGDRIEPTKALLAPGGQHLRIDGQVVKLSVEAAIGGLRPRADLTIEDAARDWPERVVLVVLTGMGNDGLRGARALKAARGVVLTEAEETCVVYGMPRSVEEAGLSDIVQPLPALSAALTGVMR